MSPRSRGISFADAPAIVIFCALAAYLAAGLFAAARPQPRFAPVTAMAVETQGETLSGLALPPGALRSQNGEDYVWAAVAGRLEKKTVNIIFADGDICLAARGTEAGSLREGDRVVIAGEELYEGKIIT